jgi:heat shock protein HtpX
MYSAIAANKRNTIVYIFVFLVIIGVLGWIASYMYGDITIMFWVLGIAAFWSLLQYFAAGSEAIALSGAIEIQKADNPRFYRVVENLSITTGTPMPRVFIINDQAPNAFATGRDPEHAMVAATSGLLDLMDDSELEAVMAHEMGHVKNYDIRVGMIVFGLVVAVGFIADILLRMSFFAGRGRDDNDNGGGNPLVLIFGIVAMILAPLVATLVQLAVSRQREYLADATSAMTTRNPEALARALQKLEDYGRPMQRQSSSMAHLWIADPAPKPNMAQRLMSTHPPIQERIARLHEMGGKF